MSDLALTDFVTDKIKQNFESIVGEIQNTPENKHTKNFSFGESLSLYALYKQSTIGDSNGKRALKFI